jgi:hypothetical protein
MAEPSAGGLKLPGVDLLRALQNPTVSGTLIVDLIPVYMVLAHGWTAAPLVLLYWLENLVIGAFAILRMIGTGLGKGVAAVGLLFLGPFFIVHYGMFCAVHGVFVAMLVGPSLGDAGGTIGALGGNPLDVSATVSWALGVEPTLTTVLLIGTAWRAVVLVWHFLIRGDWRRSDPLQEMTAPYGRIVVLHLGIFAGFFALLALGQPLWGVLGLIVARSVWGLFTSAKEAETPALRAKATATP